MQWIDYTFHAYETTKSLPSFALFLLARHPEIFQHLRSEVLSRFSQQIWGRNGNPTAEEVLGLPYVGRNPSEQYLCSGWFMNSNIVSKDRDKQLLFPLKTFLLMKQLLLPLKKSRIDKLKLVISQLSWVLNETLRLQVDIVQDLPVQLYHELRQCFHIFFCSRKNALEIIQPCPENTS